MAGQEWRPGDGVYCAAHAQGVGPKAGQQQGCAVPRLVYCKPPGYSVLALEIGTAGAVLNVRKAMASSWEQDKFERYLGLVTGT